MTNAGDSHAVRMGTVTLELDQEEVRTFVTLIMQLQENGLRMGGRAVDDHHRTLAKLRGALLQLETTDD